MTRKDYLLIAQVLARYSNERGEYTDRDAIARALADAFAAENPRFNVTKFLTLTLLK